MTEGKAGQVHQALDANLQFFDTLRFVFDTVDGIQKDTGQHSVGHARLLKAGLITTFQKLGERGMKSFGGREQGFSDPVVL